MLVGLPVRLTGLIINVPDFILLKVLTYVPFTAPTMIMMRLGAGSELSNAETATALALVAVAAVVMTWVAARTFSVGIVALRPEHHLSPQPASSHPRFGLA